MSKTNLILMVLTGIFVATPFAFADDTNVYIRLYEKRVEFAKADVKKQEAETSYQLASLARARYLVEKNAITQQEFERIEADYKKSLAEEDVLRAKVGEEEATLDVVKQLVQNSQPVPLCRD